MRLQEKGACERDGRVKAGCSSEGPLGLYPEGNSLWKNCKQGIGRNMRALQKTTHLRKSV